MEKLWSFLQKPRNQQVLGWIGGGLAVAATGAWVVIGHFFPTAPPPSAAAAKPSTVQADCSSVAVGGNVTGSTITAGNMTTSDCSQQPK